MAGDMMTGGDLPQGRHLGAAARFRMRAAGVEMAAGRRPQGTGHVALDHALGTADPRIGHRHRREKGFRIGMQGPGEQRPPRTDADSCPHCARRSPTRSNSSATRSRRAWRVIPPCSRIGSATMSPARIRGLSEESGSRERICIRRRKGRSSALESAAMSRPSSVMVAAVGAIRRSTVRPTMVLPQPLPPTRPRVSPRRMLKLTSSTGADGRWCGAAGRGAPENASSSRRPQAPAPAQPCAASACCASTDMPRSVSSISSSSGRRTR